MKILLVTATVAEAEILKIMECKPSPGGVLRFGNLDIFTVIGGIGSVSTTWNMLHWINLNGLPDIAINAGIAGSFNENIKQGEVVMPVSELFADLGIEDHDSFKTLYETGLANPDEFPYVNGIIPCDEITASHFPVLKHVKSITVNTATGSEASCVRLRSKFNPDIETMEGASFFYICQRERIPFLALRSISNFVEPRNRDNWKINLALENLAEKMHYVLLTLEKKR